MNCDEFMNNVNKKFLTYFERNTKNSLLDTLKSFSKKLVSMDLSSYLQKYDMLLVQLGYKNIAEQNHAIKQFLVAYSQGGVN